MRIELEKADSIIVAEVFEVSDAQGFSDACRELWMRLEQRSLAKTANVGELMDAAGESVAQELDGAELHFARA